MMGKGRIAAILLMILILSGCGSTYIQEKQDLMDTDVMIILQSKDSYPMELAFEEFRNVEGLMSEFKEGSQVYLLNRNKSLNNPDPSLVYVINKAVYYSAITNGSFDITVQPVLELYKKSFSKYKKPPSDKELREALRYVGYSNIMASKEAIKIPAGYKITLGGIAKGFAVDSAANILKSMRVGSALINAGGDIRVVGSKNHEGFKVAIANPDNTSDFITILNLKNISVATSGNYERYFDPDKKAHHIIDPHTGKSAQGLISVTVIAPFAIDADALATSVFVLGEEKGLKLIESIDWAEALIITENRNIIRSSGFSKYEAKD